MGIISISRQLKTALSQGGKPALQQILEAVGVRFGGRKVGISEYFDYGIWHPSVTSNLRRQFIGWRESSRLDRLLNADDSRVLANDKLVNYLMLRTLGYPIPDPIATFCTEGRVIGSERSLRNLDEVREFLSNGEYPFYVKPISAGYGRGVLGVEGVNGNFLRLLDGSSISSPDFLAPFCNAAYRGMLFQRPLKAHPSIKEMTGTDAISCVRFICFVTPGGPVIHTAFFKITTGRNMLDNFSHGDYGNCLGAVDLQDGSITRAISRFGPGGTVEKHPGTGRPLIGFKLPDWKRAIDLVTSAAPHFPGLRLQNWDVALCADGPVLVELNTESELAVPQAITGRGLMDERLQNILAEIADSGARPRPVLARA